MPIKQTNAKLWFKTPEEEKEYDDKMISNIELKSLDFDDENFSPVFTRKTQEQFLEPSLRAKSDLDKLFAPYSTRTVNDFIDKYLSVAPKSSYYRQWPVEKFLGGLFFSYFIVRELPIRNFYARCFIMWIWAGKVFDNFPLPFFGAQHLKMVRDEWSFGDMACYDMVKKSMSQFDIPNPDGKVSEAISWYTRQPAHMIRNDLGKIDTLFSKGLFSKPREVQWDGTQSMPLQVLADPHHRENRNIKFF